MTDPDAIRDIALVRLSALGDITMMLAVVRSLRAALPRARITWITGAPAFRLLEGVEGIEFFVPHRLSTLADYHRFRRQMAGRRYDVLLAAQASARANLLYPWIRAKVKVGFDRARARDGQWLFTNRRIPFARQHLLDSFFAFIEAIGVRHRILDCSIPLKQADRAWARAQLPADEGPVLAVNPAASKAERNWLATRYAEVITTACKRWGACAVLTGANASSDRALASQIRGKTSARVVDLTGRTTPKQLAALLELADCVLAPDTGPAHIAAAMGTPVVGLYAVAPSWLSAPYFSRELAVDRYDQAVRAFLGRDPAQVPWGTRVHDRRAMELIEVRDVVAALERVFRQGQRP